jgi:DNA replication protein DnaC
MQSLKEDGFAPEQIGSDPCAAFYAHQIKMLDNHKVRRRVTAYGFTCAACDGIHEAERSRSYVRSERLHRIAELKNAGVINAAILSTAFAGSDPKREDPNKVAWATARVWTPETCGNLWIYGPSNQGKTYMAWCILTAVVETGGTAGELSAGKMKTFSGYEMESQAQPFIDVDVLLIDDIDFPTWTASNTDSMRHIMNERCHKERRTLFTANCAPTKFRDKLIKARPNEPEFADAIMRRFNLSDHKCQRLAMGV